MARTPFKRTARVSSLVRQVLGELLTFEIKDPRVRGVVVTDVEVTGDLREARIFVSRPEDDADAQALMRGLNKASGWLRRELGQRIRLRVTPALDFRYDESLAYGARIESKLRELGFGGEDDAGDAGPDDGWASDAPAADAPDPEDGQDG